MPLPWSCRRISAFFGRRLQLMAFGCILVILAALGVLGGG
jgi:hypothetical protein